MSPVGVDELAVVAAAGYLALGRGGELTNPHNYERPFDGHSTGNIWPLSDYIDSIGFTYHPVVSSGFKTPRVDNPGKENEVKRKHAGADIMYKRRTEADKKVLWAPGTPNGSKWFFLPEPFKVSGAGVLVGPGYKCCPVFAVADGIVWSAKESSGGFGIVIDHGAPWATFYHHLISSTVPPTSGGKGARRVKQGQVLGFVGANPRDGKNALRHLHFEIWKGGDGDAAIDPSPHLLRWQTHNRL